MEAYLGSIFAFGFNFAPSGPGAGWALCDGRTLPISGYTTLYSLIGTTFGGDGVSTFGIPDLRGAVAVGTGQGKGLQPYALGQEGGSTSTAITVANMPSHTHTPTVRIPVGSTSDSDDGTGMYFGLADSAAGLAYETTCDTQMAPGLSATTAAGASNPPLNTVNPYLVVNYCICVNGIYPPKPNS